MPPTLLLLLWLVLAPFQYVTFHVGMGLLVDLHWVVTAACFVALLTLPVPYLGLFVVTFVGFAGATQGLGLSWWQADLVLLPFAIVSVAAMHTAGTFDIFAWPSRRLARAAASAGYVPAGQGAQSEVVSRFEFDKVAERLEREWRPRAEYVSSGEDPFDDGIVSLDPEYYANRVLLPLAKQGHVDAQYRLASLFAQGTGLAADSGEAVWWLRRAAEQDHVRAQYQLGTLYQTGNLVEQNNDETVTWFSRAAEQGYAEAQYRLGRMHADGLGVPLDKAEASRWWKLAASQGHADAQVKLASQLANGDGVQQDDVHALMWLILAAEQGHTQAIKVRDEAAEKLPAEQVEAAREQARDLMPTPVASETEATARLDDDEVAATYAQAVEAFNRGGFATAFNDLKPLAEQGHANAQYGLGVMFANGQGTERDDEAAVQWYRGAAEQGHARAEYGLGVRYADGRGVERDDAEAATWYLRAASQGDVRAQYNMGVKYAAGRGVTQDLAQARNWYLLAAERGYTRAQYNLGVLFADGTDIGRNERMAVAWYRRAAEQGDAMAQNNLGVMLANGLGGPCDIDEALVWFRRAAAQGYTRAASNLQETLDAPG